MAIAVGLDFHVLYSLLRAFIVSRSVTPEQRNAAWDSDLLQL
jgi:hypothetical protein